MKNLISLLTLALAGASLVSGTPCWDDSDTCGSAPLCTVTYTSHAPCSHTYCDSDSTCQSDGGKKRMMKKTRERYWYINPQGTAIYCVNAGSTPTPTGFCCLCAAPGQQWLEAP